MSLGVSATQDSNAHLSGDTGFRESAFDLALVGRFPAVGFFWAYSDAASRSCRAASKASFREITSVSLCLLGPQMTVSAEHEAVQCMEFGFAVLQDTCPEIQGVQTFWTT